MSELWLEVTLPVPADRLERVCDILAANGMAGLVVEEEGDFLRFLEQNRQYWDYVDEGLAQRIANKDVPYKLLDKEVYLWTSPPWWRAPSSGASLRAA